MLARGLRRRPRHARDATVTKDDGSPFQTFLRPAADDHHRRLQLRARLARTSADAGAVRPADAAVARRVAAHASGAPHPSTFCIYQKTDPSGAELHCDFIFVNDDLVPRVRALVVDQQTQASDHQPVI
jgi:endonuclease/exonuclease/phosphatase family metal-dependent hydrolase